MINAVRQHWKNEKKEDIFNMELVRISTAGSVDDGKSTLIGRLLYDHGALTVEQEELVERKTREKGLEHLDFSVITDGLTAEREQGITIDVAHIYFSTADRKFIISDSPGHVEYTRNMVTGASNSDLSIILVDARKGLSEQSFRHFFISHLLRIPQVVFCVNKMDLVAYSEDRFLQVAIEIKEMVHALQTDARFEVVPISSLKGDNVVNRSEQMPWYTGETLDGLLRNPSKKTESSEGPFRMHVQQVIHAQTDEFVDYRAFTGRIASGSLQVGDEILVLPSGVRTRVKEIRRYSETMQAAKRGDSVAVSVSDELDASRGSLFVKQEQPMPLQNGVVNATLVWMDEVPATPGKRFLLKAGSRDVPVRLSSIKALIDPVHPAKHIESTLLTLNAIAQVELKAAAPPLLDDFSLVKQNGAFILIDEQTNRTVALGFAGSPEEK